MSTSCSFARRRTHFHSSNFFSPSLFKNSTILAHLLKDQENVSTGYIFSSFRVDPSTYQRGRAIEEGKKLIYFTFVAQSFCLDPTDLLVERVLNDRSSSLGLANEARPVLRSLYFPTHSATVSRESRWSMTLIIENNDNGYCASERKKENASLSHLSSLSDLSSNYSTKKPSFFVKLVEFGGRKEYIAFIELKISRPGRAIAKFANKWILSFSYN